MSNTKTGTQKVKARASSTLGYDKKKVGFIPSDNSTRRIAMSSEANHIDNVNNIARFGSVR